jgi:hypothetical protein
MARPVCISTPLASRRSGRALGITKAVSMKRSRQVMLVLAFLLLLGIWLWLPQAPRSAGPSVGLALITNSPNQPPTGMVFRITNDYARAILLTHLIVETNCPAGWQAFSHAIPTHPQRLATGDTKDLVITPPPHEQTWRLRVTYGTDVKGPGLWLGKAEHAVSQRAWPGQGFGIMAGSNSCISGEMTR